MKKLSFLFTCLLLNMGLYAQQNIILIIADDVSPDYFGCFSTTTDTAKTPYINALASAGVKFTQVWGAPVCSPARASLLTGRYPFRTGVGGVITNVSSPQIDTAEMSIAKLLKYHAPVSWQTACVGKWHLTLNTPARRLNPNKLGFDLYSGNFNGAIPDYYDYVRVKNGITDTVKVYATTQTVNDAIDWLDTINRAKPFFLWLAFNAPHDPYHVPPASLCDTAGLTGTPADISTNPKKYFKAALQAMDTEIGRLLTYLSNNNLRDSTHIIFIADNGNQQQVAQIATPSKSKGTIYHYGVHVPLIVAGPSVVNKNRTSSELIHAADLFATIPEMGGFTNWKNFIPLSTVIDGRSFLHILKNETGTNRTWIFTETFNAPATSDDGKSIRNKDYHLLRFDNGNEAFYQLSTDKEENNNLLNNPQTMTQVDVANYHLLCDSMAALTGISGCLPVSVNEEPGSETIAVYPNPGSGLFTIQYPESIPIEADIVSLYGQHLQALKLQPNTHTIDLSGNADGIYYLKLRAGEKVWYRILVKQTTH